MEPKCLLISYVPDGRKVTPRYRSAGCSVANALIFGPIAGNAAASTKRLQAGLQLRSQRHRVREHGVRVSSIPQAFFVPGSRRLVDAMSSLVDPPSRSPTSTTSAFAPLSAAGIRSNSPAPPPPTTISSKSSATLCIAFANVLKRDRPARIFVLVSRRCGNLNNRARLSGLLEFLHQGNAERARKPGSCGRLISTSGHVGQVVRSARLRTQTAASQPPLVLIPSRLSNVSYAGML